MHPAGPGDAGDRLLGPRRPHRPRRGHRGPRLLTGAAEGVDGIGHVWILTDEATLRQLGRPPAARVRARPGRRHRDPGAGRHGPHPVVAPRCAAGLTAACVRGEGTPVCNQPRRWPPQRSCWRSPHPTCAHDADLVGGQPARRGISGAVPERDDACEVRPCPRGLPWRSTRWRRSPAGAGPVACARRCCGCPTGPADGRPPTRASGHGCGLPGTTASPPPRLRGRSALGERSVVAPTVARHRPVGPGDRSSKAAATRSGADWTGVSAFVRYEVRTTPIGGSGGSTSVSPAPPRARTPTPPARARRPRPRRHRPARRPTAERRRQPAAGDDVSFLGVGAVADEGEQAPVGPPGPGTAL